MDDNKKKQQNMEQMIKVGIELGRDFKKLENTQGITGRLRAAFLLTEEHNKLADDDILGRDGFDRLNVHFLAGV